MRFWLGGAGGRGNTVATRTVTLCLPIRVHGLYSIAYVIYAEHGHVLVCVVLTLQGQGKSCQSLFLQRRVAGAFYHGVRNNSISGYTNTRRWARNKAMIYGPWLVPYY